MTNYDCYFGTKERTLDSLSMLLEFPNHPRKEVREFQEEVRKIGAFKWLQLECINQRWWAGIPLIRKDKNVSIKKEFRGNLKGE